jgi:ketosteroid isomerase-like protein
MAPPVARLEGQTADEDEATLRALETRGRLGVLNRDLEALQAHWSEDFVVNAPRNRVVPDRSAVLDLIRKGQIHYSSFESEIEYVRIDGDIAIVMGRETVQPVGDAPLAGETVERRYTHVWQRQGGTWLLIARHANNVCP